VLELGCGTGRLAERLLAERLPEDARYLGLDVSPRMVALAEARLRPWSDRAEVLRVDGTLPLPVPDASCDRFLVLWVLDLMDDAAAAAALADARRALEPGGLLCVAGLAPGARGLPRLVSRGWEAVWRLSPALVGGCRPRELVLPDGFAVRHRRTVVSWAVASEVVVAERVPNAS